MPRVTGSLHELTIDGDKVAAFVPAPLPPRDPPLALDARATELLERAQQGLRELDSLLGLVPSVEWIVPAFALKEAVASLELQGQLEGRKARLLDLLAHAAGARVPGSSGDDDVHGVMHAIEALAYCREELTRPNGARISIRLVNQAHRRLARQADGNARPRGLLRAKPIWIGGACPREASYVPPPPFEVAPLFEELEKFCHRPSTLPPLVQIGLVYAQFDSIQPYLEHNGRLGRLLITLMLEDRRLLRAPLLYLSVFFKRRRDDTQRLLAAVRTKGDWESWILFFLEGVATMAAEAREAARGLFALVARDRDAVLSSPRASVAGLRLLAQLPRHPVVTVPMTVELLDTTAPTAAKAVALLQDLGVLQEISGRRRDRAFSYARFVELGGEGLE